MEDESPMNEEIGSEQSRDGEEFENEEPKIPILADEDIEKNVLVGVCGVQASGKTVFLASIFHNVHGTHVDGVGRVTLDRKDKGGERYFRIVEDTIRKKGRTEPTRESAVARLLVDQEEFDEDSGSIRGLILFDFAGGRFTDFADIETAIREEDSEQAKRDLRLVERYLEECDALILLIDSTGFRHGDGPSESSPFSASVVYLRDFCAKEGKPIAMVFTKSDMNRDLTLDKILGFDRVREFMKSFQSDPSDESLPFGLVALLTCYEIDPVNGRVSQHEDGSIWHRETREVFARILKVTWPKAAARIQGIIDKRETERREAREAELRDKQRKRRRWQIAAALFAIAVALALAWSQFQEYDQRVSDLETAAMAASLFERDLPERVGVKHREAIKRLLGSRNESDVERALGGLEAAYRASLNEVPASAYTGEARLEITDSLLKLSPILGASGLEGLDLLRLNERLIPLLESPKSESLESRLALARQIDAAADGSTDRPFAKAMLTGANQVRAACADEVVDPGYNTTTLIERVTFVRERLAEDRKRTPDARWRTALKRSYARLIGAALTDLLDRENVVKFLRAANPDFEPLLSTATQDFVELVRYRFIRDTIRKSDVQELAHLRGSVGSLLPALTHRDDRTSYALEDTLRQIFRTEGGAGSDRIALWRRFFEGADSEYVFALEGDAWPPGKSPWKDSLHAELRVARYSREKTQEVIAAISQRPLYWWEIGGLITEAGDRYLQLETVRLYEVAIQQVSAGNGAQNTRGAGRAIRKIGDLSGALHQERLSHLSLDHAYLMRGRDVASDLADQLESANTSRGRSSAEVRVWLRQYCRSQVRRYGVSCAN